MLRDPILKLNTKPIQRNLPFWNRHVPFLADISHCEVQQFAQRLINWNRSTVLRNLARAHVHEFDGIGGINRLANVGRIVKERNNTLAVAPPGLHNGRIAFVLPYRVISAESGLLYRHDGKPVDTRKHEGRVAVKESDVRWSSDGLELSCDSGERLRVAFALDCCDREIMSWVATTKGIDAAERPESQTAMAQLPKCYDDCNSCHPHSALGYVPAKLFRDKKEVN